MNGGALQRTGGALDRTSGALGGTGEEKTALAVRYKKLVVLCRRLAVHVRGQYY